MRLIREGKLPHCPGFVYGFDRLYLDAAGVPQFILRKVKPNVIERRHPETGQVLGIMSVDNSFRRTSFRLPGGSIVLVPGDPDRMAVVQRIMTLRYIDKWGVGRIACLLNDEGIPAPCGKLWGDSTIWHFVTNRAYTGVGVANLTSRGKYCSRGTDTPVIYEVPREQQPKKRFPHKTCKYPPAIIRKEEDWHVKEISAAGGFLPPELHDAVVAGQEAAYESRERANELNRANRKAGGDRHFCSTYLLSGIARSRQGGLSMTGTSTGAGHRKKYRSYKAAHYAHYPRTDPLVGRSIQAEPLEEAVLRAIKDSVTMPDQIEKEVRDQVEKALAADFPGIVEYANDEFDFLQTATHQRLKIVLCQRPILSY